MRDGKIIAGAPKERFNRQKRTNRFPLKAAEFCFNFANISFQEVDYVAQGWNPGASWHRYNPLFSGLRVELEDYSFSVPDNLFNLAEKRTPTDWTLMSFPDESPIPSVYYVQHHRGHAATAE